MGIFNQQLFGGGGGTYQSKIVNPTTSEQTVIPDEGYDALSEVIVNAVLLESKVLTPTLQSQVITPVSPNIGLSQVTTYADGTLCDINNIPYSIVLTDDSLISSTLRERVFAYRRMTEVIFNTTAPLYAKYMFQECTELSNVIFNNPQTTISYDMFWNCKKLTKLDCPQSLVTIEVYGFEYCTELSVLILRSIQVCTLADISAFFHTPFRNGTGGVVYVPQNLISQYQNGTNWSALESCTFLPIEGSQYE